MDEDLLAFAFMSVWGAVLLYLTALAIRELVTRGEARRSLLTAFRRRPVAAFFKAAMCFGTLGFVVLVPLGYFGFEPTVMGWRLWSVSVILMIAGLVGAIMFG